MSSRQCRRQIDFRLTFQVVYPALRAGELAHCPGLSPRAPPRELKMAGLSHSGPIVCAAGPGPTRRAMNLEDAFDRLFDQCIYNRAQVARLLVDAQLPVGTGAVFENRMNVVNLFAAA